VAINGVWYPCFRYVRSRTGQRFLLIGQPVFHFFQFFQFFHRPIIAHRSEEGGPAFGYGPLFFDIRGRRPGNVQCSHLIGANVQRLVSFIEIDCEPEDILVGPGVEDDAYPEEPVSDPGIDLETVPVVFIMPIALT